SAVQAGHSISEVANATEGELERRLELSPVLPTPPLDPILEAIEQLDAPTTERLLSGLLAVLGPTRFVRTVATPLLHTIGARWEAGQLCAIRCSWAATSPSARSSTPRRQWARPPSPSGSAT
ncbi:MAG: hypothetical protein NTZ61_00895, partial [Proteobacteria bacterium]|nr:hypothetical protein [Pseudomonadota bacterium]